MQLSITIIVCVLRIIPFIALRYLFSKKSRNVINIISGISAITVMVITAALIILLSAFNGLESWVISLFNHADPPLKIELLEGKMFDIDSSLTQKLKNVEGVEDVSPVLQDNALFMYGDKQYIGVLKGINPDNPAYKKIGPLMLDGDPDIFSDSTGFALVGAGVANILGINLDNLSRRIVFFFPKRSPKIDIFKPYRSNALFPGGVFSIQQDYDSRYIWVPYSIAEEVLDAGGRMSAYEIDLKQGVDADRVKERIKPLLPQGLTVKNRMEQQAVFYKVFKTERFVLTVILTFILILASFNIFGSMTMLLVEKRRDTAVLRSLGLSASRIRSVFWLQGFFISLFGCLIGVVVGLGVCMLQIQMGWLKTGSQAGAPPYPVIIDGRDVLLSIALVLITGALVSFFRMQLVKPVYFSASLRSGR